MNETVRGMVEKLFENTLMNDETQALRDEVMNNCQERFEDLTARGLSEEEALTAVSDSLKGMEEIVAAYPRKEEPAPEPGKLPAAQSGPLRFSPAEVTRLTARLTDSSLEVLPGDDADIVVEITHGPETELTASLEEGVLYICQKHISGGAQPQDSAPFGARASRAPWDNVASSINEAIRQLTQTLQRFTSVSGEANRVRVFLPGSCSLVADLQSLSGSLSWNGAPVNSMLMDTTSGDLDAVAPAGKALLVAQFKTASGDIRADLDAEDLTLQSMSGDVHWSGTAQRLTATSISGDLEMAGRFISCALKSVSGDVDVTADETLTLLKAASTSGDIQVNLPAAVSAARLRLNTIGGSTHINNLFVSEAAPLAVEADSVSGDITVNRHKL